MNEFYDFFNKNLLDIIATTASVFATFVAIKSFSTSKEALRIAQKEHIEKNKILSIKLLDIERQNSMDGSWIYLNISIINNATFAKTLKDVFLEVHYLDIHSTVQLVKLTSTADPHLVENNTYELKMPINIDSRTTLTGHIYYKLPDKLRQNAIEKFRLVTIDTDDNNMFVESELWRVKDVT